MNDYSGDPARIERELAETRARFGNHLDELTRRLSPGQLLDEGVSYLRDGQGAAFVRNLGADVRDNPLPLALTAIGLAWLGIATSTSRRKAQSWRSASDGIVDRATRAGEAVTRSTEDTEESFRARIAEARAKVLGLQQNAAETATAFTARVQQALEAAQQRTREGLDGLRQGAAEWRDDLAAHGQRASAAVSQVSQQGRAMAARAGDGIVQTVGHNPLLLGALGLAAGALMGAVLPRSNQEEALIAPLASRAAEATREATDDAIERGSRAAQAAASAAYDEAVRE